MILMLKRFLMDDVPVKLFPVGTTMAEAVTFARGAYEVLPEFADAQDQCIAQADIGSELEALLLVEFNANGEPVESRVVNNG